MKVLDFPGGPVVKNPPASAEDMGSIPGPGRFHMPQGNPGKNTGEGCHALLQEIFPTQGSNPDLPHCRWILYQLSHKGSPICIYYILKIK